MLDKMWIENRDLARSQSRSNMLGVEIRWPPGDDPLEGRAKGRIGICHIEKSFILIEKSSQECQLRADFLPISDALPQNIKLVVLHAIQFSAKPLHKKHLPVFGNFLPQTGFKPHPILMAKYVLQNGLAGFG